MSSGRRLPSSLMAPSPTATTLPFCGFSLAVSGRTMPLAVVSSSSTGFTISRSPRGFRFINEPPSFGRWFACQDRKNAGPQTFPARYPPWHSLARSPNKRKIATERTRVGENLALAASDCQRGAGTGRRSVQRQQLAAEGRGDPFAAAPHHPVVVPLEDRPQERRHPVHPRLRRRHVPLVEDRGDPVLLEEAPATGPFEVPHRLPLH